MTTAAEPRRYVRSFTNAQILEIRTRYWAGESQRALAVEFGSYQTMICTITLRLRYADPAKYPVAPGELEPRVRGRQGHKARLTDAHVSALRQLWWAGVASQAELAGRFGISQPSVFLILQRHTYKWVTPFPGELDLIRRWYALPRGARHGGNIGREGRRSINYFLDDIREPESSVPVDTGTGRLQQLCDGAWATHADIRRAELATGLDRLEIAQALLDGRSWRYEPGAAPPPSTAILGDTPVWSELHMNPKRYAA